MVSHSLPKTLNSIHLSAMKPPPSSSSSSSSMSLSSMKLKTHLRTLIFSNMERMGRAVSKAKSVLLQLLRDINLVHFLQFPLKMRSKSNKKQKNLLFGSFRLHYNWCSNSHVMPVMMETTSHLNNPRVYYDGSWNSVIKPTLFEYDDEIQESTELSAYLKWIEEEKGNHLEEMNEIDRLADLFIANCHEKFRLEKQESYRRFQEMIATSV